MIDQLVTSSGCRIAKYWTEISRERTSRPKANPFPHNCKLPEDYICLFTPHENKHPYVVAVIKMGAYIHGVLILCGCLLSRFYSILKTN